MRHFFALTLAVAALHVCVAPRALATEPGNSHVVTSRFVVISDVDDTIKKTGVTIGRSHLKNLPWLLVDPIRPWQPVAGMPELYHALNQRITSEFIYVSKGPEFSRARLRRALAHYRFPAGQIILNADFPFAPADYKFAVIARIINRSKRYVLIGDSGEFDPENYGKLARKFPRQIDRIMIRSVTADREGRYRSAFRGVAHSRWEVFASPQDLKISVRGN